MRDARLKVVAVEIDPARHCNLRCFACSHASPFAPVELTPVESIERDAALLGRYLHAGRV